MCSRVPECEVCHGTGYVLKNHTREKCDECEGHGSWSKVLGHPLSAIIKQAQRDRAKIDEQVANLQDEIDTKESQIDDLQDDINSLESDIDDLKRKKRALLAK